MSRLDHTLKLVPASQRDIARDEIESLIKAERQRTLDEVEGLIGEDEKVIGSYEYHRNSVRTSLREQIKALKDK